MRRYTFAPPPAAAEIAGIPVRLVVLVGAGIGTGLLCHRLVGGAWAELVPLALIAGAGLLALIRIDGYRPEQLLVLRARHAWRARRAAPLLDVELIDHGIEGGGVIVRRSAHGELRLTGIVEVDGAAFAFAEDGDQVALLERWGRTLAARAGDRPAICSLQLLQIVAPAPNQAEIEHLEATADRGSPFYRDYRQQRLDQAWQPRVRQLIGIQTSSFAPAGGGLRGLSLDAALTLLRVETDALLAQADGTLGPARRVSAAEISWLVRCALDPTAADGPADLASELMRHGGVVEHRAHLRAERFLHRTFAVCSWPAADVASDFLLPLLLDLTAIRTLSVTLSPVAQPVAAREVSGAQTHQLSDLRLRHRGGFLDSQARAQRRRAAARWEEELARGEGLYAVSAYLRVTGSSPDDLARSAAAVEARARQCQLTLAPLQWQQADAFLATLPLGGIKQ